MEDAMNAKRTLSDYAYDYPYAVADAVADAAYAVAVAACAAAYARIKSLKQTADIARMHFPKAPKPKENLK